MGLCDVVHVLRDCAVKMYAVDDVVDCVSVSSAASIRTPPTDEYVHIHSACLCLWDVSYVALLAIDNNTNANVFLSFSFRQHVG